MRPADRRLNALLGMGAGVFRASFDLVPDPVGVLWAIRDGAGAVVDFETGYSNPAMDRMLGMSIERSFGRRLLEEAPAFEADETFRRMLGVVGRARRRWSRRSSRAPVRSPRSSGRSCIARSRSGRTRC